MTTNEKKEPSSDMNILRRIAERGLELAQREGNQFIDIFQHMLDEIERVTPNAEVSGAASSRPLD